MVRFQIVFSRYLVVFFELYLHIWCLGSYLNMFSGKIKVFMKKYFFESWGRFWIEISTIWMVYCWVPFGSLFQKNRPTLRENRSSSKSFWSWASLRFTEAREGHWIWLATNSQPSTCKSRSPKQWFPFFCKLDRSEPTTWWNPLITTVL